MDLIVVEVVVVVKMMVVLVKEVGGAREDFPSRQSLNPVSENDRRNSGSTRNA